MTASTVGERMQLRGERAPFVMLPRWLLYHPEVDPGAKFLYCILHDLVNGREGPTRPVTRAQLGEACGVSVDTIDRRLAELVAAGAVDKQAQVRSGGQVANVYQVWFTPRAGLHRSDDAQPKEAVDNRSRIVAAPVEGAANSQVGRSRESAAPPPGSGPEPHACGTPDRADAAPFVLEEQEEENPPQPPRTAGGPTAPHDDNDQDEEQEPRRAVGGRRAEGTSLRALGANPRAEADRAEEAERLRMAAERDLAVAAEAARRDAEAAAAQAAVSAFEAESAALSAILDDDRLAAVVDLAGTGLAGPLARSPLAAARAVVAWCRAAVGEYAAAYERDPELLAVLDAALADRWQPALSAPTREPLELPGPPAGTPTLRDRLAPMVRLAAVDDAPQHAPSLTY